ncbi:GntR family transcriptional regulator [Kordiimonas aestuarii]|uniref:GntR family transcriptional regulator n=1 Tax=Kordiimonas aestuarii TaxID=1005925 RepID=UPI002943E242|nr:GntR family transcriptional regulator [Kordiimonas aestuarii]
MDAIVTQKLAPSQKVSESVLCDMFAISRSVARAIIERLIARHFLVSVSPRVTIVAPLTLSQIKENFMLRKILLPEIFSLASRHADYDELYGLNRQLNRMLPTEDDKAALDVLKLNKRLNLAICEKSDYPLMLDWAQQLEDTVMRIYWLYVKVNNSFFYSEEQIEMSLEVMKKGEAAHTRQVMYDLLCQTEERILNSIFSHKKFCSQDLIL